MKNQKIVIAVVVALLAILAMCVFVGCEKITPAQIQQTVVMQRDSMQTMVNSMRAAADQMKQSMALAGIIDPNMVAQIDAIEVKADKLQAQIDAVAVAIASTPLTDDQTQNWIGLARSVNIAVPTNYTPLIEIILASIAGIAGVIAKRKSDAAATAETKYQAHKEGVELTMKEVSASAIPEVRAVETQLYDNIGGARTALGVK